MSAAPVRPGGMRLVAGLVVLLLAVAGGLAGYAYLRERPQDLPWTALDLTRPIGLFTGRKLVALRQDPRLCRALLDAARVPHVDIPPRDSPPQCGFSDGIRLADDRRGAPDYRPGAPGTSCAVAAALIVWEREVVAPAALRAFGQKVRTIDHFGSYSCRRPYGRARGRWSEHAAANAIDIAGFRLADGRRIIVAGDWRGEGREARFLRDVRNGACRLFATTLSPDYNAAHRDHLHLDQAERATGWRMCR